MLSLREISHKAELIMPNSILTQEESAALKLRELYHSCGYSFYRMRRFEEYDFYADKKDFLTSSAILAFTDINGKLMALRPDVTLSVIKHAPSGKYYYDEKVYRVPKNADTFREISQCGIEYIGDIGDSDIHEVIMLAVKSLHALSDGRRCVLDAADAGKVSQLLPERNRAEILKCLAGKNVHGLRELGAPDELVALAEYDGEFPGLPESLGEYRDEIRTDYSAVGNIRYYNGIVFKGYIEGIPEAVLSGGQYFMAGTKGVGFAVYLDALEGGCRD